MSKRNTITEPLSKPLSPVQRGIEHLMEMEKEALRIYRPATDAQDRIHRSKAHELLVRGGKRSAKTTCGLAEFVSRITGERIIDRDEKPIPKRYRPSTVKDPRLYWLIGWDLRHIGQTIFPKLFEPGLFRVIRDKETGKLRTWNPAVPEDMAREDESDPAGPLIPPRLIVPDSWSWDNSAGGKSGNVFRSVRLVNGATICAYPSSAKASKQGDAVSGILIDEDIQFPDHLQEFQDRLTDKDGWLMWTVWPHMSNYALVSLLDRAQEVEEEDNPNIEAVQLLMSDNPFFTEDTKGRALERMGDAENIARRDRGDLLQELTTMYEFAPAIHGLGGDFAIDVVGRPTNVKELLEMLYKRDGIFPDEWTRYLSIDPSHTRTAVLFGAVTPPNWMGIDLPNALIVEDELILKRASAEVLATAIREKMRTRNYEAFIMDRRMGRQTRVGSTLTVFQTYAEAFKNAQCFSRMTKNSFLPSCDKPEERWPAVREMLQGAGSGPYVYFALDKTILTQKEFKTYRKKQRHLNGSLEIYDEPANPRSHDAMAALEYLCTYIKEARQAGIAHVQPQAYGGGGSQAYQFAKSILAKQAKQQPGPDYVHLGPGAAA